MNDMPCLICSKINNYTLLYGNNIDDLFEFFYVKN